MIRFVAVSLLVLASLPTPGVMQANGDLRLTGKPLGHKITKGYGRLEIFFSGMWGTICGPVDRSVADAACRQMGYNASILNGSVETLKVTEVNESTPIVLGFDGCRQDYIADTKPQHILRCNYLTDVSNCSHESAAALQCDHHKTDFYDTEVRLSNGTWPSSGVLEVYIKPKLSWGTVCFSNFTGGSAEVACRQMGYTNAIFYAGVNNPPGSTIWLPSAKCNGSLSQFCINECFSDYPTNPVDHCFGHYEHTVVFLNCTFDPYFAAVHPGDDLCTFIHPSSKTTLYIIWSVVGILALGLVVIFIIVVVAVIVGVIKAKPQRTRYVQVDSDGDAVN